MLFAISPPRPPRRRCAAGRTHTSGGDEALTSPLLVARVRSLADQIIEAQRLEIAEMKALIADLEGGPAATPEIDGQ